MSFKDISLKTSYSSEKDNILENFYIPVLKQARVYKRITGYFSSSAFALSAEGLSEFIQNEGTMQFITNIQLSEEDYNSIEQGLKDPIEIIENYIIEEIEELKNDLKNDSSKILGWLIAKGQLELKIGFIKERYTGKEILHQKVGILIDEEGNKISFSGSNNESASGWKYNSEKFKVFCDWDGGKEYVEDDLEDFNELWNNMSKKTQVIEFPEAAKNNLIRLAPKTKEDFEKIIEKISNISETNKEKNSKIGLRNYQLEAIDNWEKNNFKGIFEMATGTGKTYTAVGALKQVLDNQEKILAVISCPTLHLLPQWEKSLKNSGIHSNLIYASSNNSKWRQEMQSKILDLKLGRDDKLIILTTHDTCSGNNFLDLLNESTFPTIFIGDEIHGMGSGTHKKGLSEKYDYRLGLTATPNRYFDEDGTDYLIDYFSGIVFKFDLDRAISEINPDTGKSYLTPYDYKPFFVNLLPSEMDEFQTLSAEIARLSNIEEKNKSQEDRYQQKMRDRANILKNSIEKYDGISQILDELIQVGSLDKTLIYCSPQQIEKVQEIVREKEGVIQHKFTNEEDATKRKKEYGNLTEREYILDCFDNGIYNVLVAIKCLDEGVDVPSTKIAILASNTGNPKEWIQRRGRVLRRSEGKEKAVLFDLITLPPQKTMGLKKDIIEKVLESQFRRMEEFGNSSLNKSEVSRKIYKIKEDYIINKNE